MKKLKKERKKFNRDYLRPITGGVILFVLLVIFLIIFNYNPKTKETEKKTTDNYHLNVDDVSVNKSDSCDSTFYKSVIEEVNKIDISLKTSSIDGETYLDEENSTEGHPVYYTSKLNVYEITLNKIPENVKLVITDDSTDITNTITKENNMFVAKYVNDLVKYNVIVYGNVDNCNGAVLRQFNFTTPAFNVYKDTTICTNNDSDGCKDVIYEEVDLSEVTKKYNKENNNTKEEKKNNILTIIIISASIVVVVAVVIFVLYRNRRKRMVM